MPRRLGHRGVTLIELLVVLAIMTFVLAASSRLLTAMLTQFKQQTKIAETSIESLIGLEVLRRDLFSTGFGLPHKFESGITYYEADTSLSPAKLFNDSPSGIPRPILANTPTGMINDSYYMVIKSLRVADNNVAGKFQFLEFGNNRTTWSPASEDLPDDARILVYYFDTNNDFALAMYSGEWRPGGTGSGKGTYMPDTNTENWAPADIYRTRIIYGVNEDPDALRFPFNRADYYITNGAVPYVSDTVPPARCAPGTGVLVKAVLKNDNDDGNGGGTFDYNGDGSPDEMPILDCVLDFQVGVFVDTDEDKVGDLWTSAESYLDGNSSSDVRKQLKEVRVYILAHEGQFDSTFEYPDQNFYVGDYPSTGGSIDLAAKVGAKWRNYRWKLYTLVVQPGSLNAILK